MTDHSHLHDAATWVYNNIAPIGLITGGIFGSALWAWREYMKRYATTKAVFELREDNERQHSEIKQIISNNHVELLKTIMDKHK